MKGAWFGSLKKALKAGLALGAERSRRAGCRLRIRDEYWFIRLLVRDLQFINGRLLLRMRSKCAVRGSVLADGKKNKSVTYVSRRELGLGRGGERLVCRSRIGSGQGACYLHSECSRSMIEYRVC